MEGCCGTWECNVEDVACLAAQPRNLLSEVLLRSMSPAMKLLLPDAGVCYLWERRILTKFELRWSSCLKDN